MLTKIIIILGTIAVASAAATSKEEVRRPNEDHITWYDCSAKQNGNYTNPRDCTRFIICSNGGAADMACPDCDKNNIVECAGQEYLHYNSTTETCEWPVHTPCAIGGDPTTTTAAPTDPSTTASPKLSCPNGVTVGDSCDADDCELCGWCVDKTSHYLRCNRTQPSSPSFPTTGIVVHAVCDFPLWWNPIDKPTTLPGAGGECDFWESLPKSIQDQYLNDPNCIKPECEYGQDAADECTENYWYKEPGQAREDLKCNPDPVSSRPPIQLIWDPAVENCRTCASVPTCAGKGSC